MSQTIAFTTEVIALYLREDLQELENPLRQDHGVLLQDLRFLYRSYWYAVQPKQDWAPALNNMGGN